MELAILGIVLAIVAIAAAGYAWRVALRQTERATRAEVQGEARALALQNQEAELARIMAEREDLLSQWGAFVDMLKGAGIIRQTAPALGLSREDLTYQVATVVAGVPSVPAMDPATLQAALARLAERAFSNNPNAARPMSRPYMVGDAAGQVTRGQYEKLREAMLREGYLETPAGRTESPELTEAGRAMLDAVRTGRLLVQ